MGCLNALGADIIRTDSGYRVIPTKEIPRQTALRCHDSGSTAVLLPVAGALSVDAIVSLEGRLPSRLSPRCGRKWNVWAAPSPAQLRIPFAAPGVCGREYTSSTAAFPASLLRGCCFPPPDSGKKPHPSDREGGIPPLYHHDPAGNGNIWKRNVGFCRDRRHSVPLPRHADGGGRLEQCRVLPCCKDVGQQCRGDKPLPGFPQGDRAVFDLLPALENSPVISAADIPDLVPILAVTAACKMALCSRTSGGCG